MDQPAPEGRAALVAGRMRRGKVPEPIRSIGLVDFAQDDHFELLLSSSGHLDATAQVEVANYLVQRVLAEDRAVRWLGAITARALPRDALRRLIEAWRYLRTGQCRP